MWEHSYLLWLMHKFSPIYYQSIYLVCLLSHQLILLGMLTLFGIQSSLYRMSGKKSLFKLVNEFINYWSILIKYFNNVMVEFQYGVKSLTFVHFLPIWMLKDARFRGYLPVLNCLEWQSLMVLGIHWSTRSISITPPATNFVTGC